MRKYFRSPRVPRPASARLPHPWVFLLLLTVLAGCSRVSPQAVVLAEVVSQRLTAVEQSHEAFVRGYFDQSRQRIESFLTDRWTPHFLDRFVHDATGDGEDLVHALENATPFDPEEVERLREAFETRGVSDPEAALRAVEEALGGGEQGRVALEFAEAAIGQIEKKRRALLDPIDDLERRTLQEMRGAYGQIQQAQSSVTGHLRSLVTVQEEQDQVLRRAGLLERRDRFMERAIAVNQGVVGILDAGKGLEETLAALEENAQIVVNLGAEP